MKKINFTKETIGLSLILMLSAVLNFANIGIEGYGNGYYAAGVKSMTMSLKNFFFVSFDPSAFVTIDKPPIGFWIQAIFAKIFGFSGWSILLPQAIAGVISVYLIYYIVKRSFGTTAGIISSLCLAVTPVFVAASRNNTIDNLLVVTLLFACLALTIGAEKGKARYLYISLVLVGIGFNIKMLEAYMIGPAIYISYLLSSTISFKKKISHLVIGTVILFAVSLSWALIVDLVPSQNRPFVGSSTNNSVIELIVGHNGLERLGIGNKSGGGVEGNNDKNQNSQRGSENIKDISNANNQDQIIYNENGQVTYGSSLHGNDKYRVNMQRQNEGTPGYLPGIEFGGMPGGNGLGSFGGKTPATITRLFSKNSLSDQIVWFFPLALLGFIAGAIKEKLRFKLDNKRKLSLVLWFLWVIPGFIYFSFTKGLFHPYYLTMMAPPIAALAGIGISTMWQLYKEGGLKSCFLPAAFIIEGLTHMLMLSYYYSSISTIVRNVIIVALVLCFVSSIMLIMIKLVQGKDESNLKNNKSVKLKKGLVGIGLIGILITPLIGSIAPISHKLNSTIPCAGLELLLNNNERDGLGKESFKSQNNSNTKLIEFLESHKTNEKYLLAVSSSQSVDNVIIETGEPVMAIGGFSGSDNILSLDQFKELVKNGEVRYVLTGGIGKGGNSEIMNWVTENGKAVPESEYKDVSTLEDEAINNKEDIRNSQNQGSESQERKFNANDNKNRDSGKQNFSGTEGRNSGQLYDLKDVTDTLN